MKSFLHFDELTLPNKKTKTWLVRNKQIGNALGAIKWYAPWRRYCFFTGEMLVIFDANCLGEIQSFVNKAMHDHLQKHFTKARMGLVKF